MLYVYTHIYKNIYLTSPPAFFNISGKNQIRGNAKSVTRAAFLWLCLTGFVFMSALDSAQSKPTGLTRTIPGWSWAAWQTAVIKYDRATLCKHLGIVLQWYIPGYPSARDCRPRGSLQELKSTIAPGESFKSQDSLSSSRTVKKLRCSDKLSCKNRDMGAFFKVIFK